MPPTVPLDHDCGPENQQNRTVNANDETPGEAFPPPTTSDAALFHYSMLTYSKQPACLEHSNLFKVNVPNSPSATIKSRQESRETNGGRRSVLASRRTDPTQRPTTPTPSPTGSRLPEDRDSRRRLGPRNPTTSFLTATTLIYAIGAGITAAAGTRLALQLFLVKGFGLYSFQLPDHYRDRHCYLLSLPPRVGIG